MVVHEACLTGGAGAEIAARIQERAPRTTSMRPIARVSRRGHAHPAERVLEQYCVPSVDDVVEGARALVRS